MAEDCLNESRFVAIETRLKTIEEKQVREDTFRTEFYNYQRDQIEHDVRIDERMKSIDDKLITLVSWQEEQKSKPIKRWDGLIDKILWFVIGSVLAYLATKAGLQP